jgi:hypothetical protein
MLPVDAAEMAPARPEDHRHHVHGDLVHEPGREDLAAHLTGGSLTGEFRALAIPAADEVVRRLGVPALGFRPCDVTTM